MSRKLTKHSMFIITHSMSLYNLELTTEGTESSTNLGNDIVPTHVCNKLTNLIKPTLTTTNFDITTDIYLSIIPAL